MNTSGRRTSSHVLFADRVEAGEAVAEALKDFFATRNALVLGLARGGVPVAAVVAKRLRLPMDVYMVRKLGVPGNEELAMGAIAPGGIRILNQEILRHVRDADAALERAVECQQQELQRREQVYRGNLPRLELLGRTVIVIDDGLATGATMLAAVLSIQQCGASFCLAAAPVGSSEACRCLKDVADRVVCVRTPDPFVGVARFYGNFDEVPDEQVREALAAGTAAASGRCG